MVDLLPAFQDSASNSLFLRNVSISFDSVHPSVAGDQIAAGAISKALPESLARQADDAGPRCLVKTAQNKSPGLAAFREGIEGMHATEMGRKPSR